MIEIHWLWIPAIVTVILIILTFIFEDPEIGEGVFSILASFSALISLIIYFIVIVLWLFTNVKILT